MCITGYTLTRNYLQTLMNVTLLVVSTVTIAMATLNASTLLDHTSVTVRPAMNILIRIHAQVCHVASCTFSFCFAVKLHTSSVGGNIQSKF